MSIYAHFASKAELVWELLDVEFAALAERLAAAEDEADDPVARLRARCNEYVRYGLEQPGRFTVLFGTAGRPAPPDVAPHELPGWPAFAGFVAAIERCTAAGAAAQVDARAAAIRLWVALHGMTVLRVSKKGFPRPPAEQLVDELLHELVLASSVAGDASDGHQ
jgi:AcrR family transcriptional regulator